ncbi:hypothetical protein CYMTET_50676 [Cymbomonas tetramitiformis]|uniref:Uncharacterized protein n=1 Tax=Cymbomonas tetramitiformis TaxID=36881 RepID=A0AAE0BNR2_9CHLO|nr:hypothetical protein CYMTET_50676 [Cymbomonas tetramitiformis]
MSGRLPPPIQTRHRNNDTQPTAQEPPQAPGGPVATPALAFDDELTSVVAQLSATKSSAAHREEMRQQQSAYPISAPRASLRSARDHALPIPRKFPKLPKDAHATSRVPHAATLPVSVPKGGDYVSPQEIAMQEELLRRNEAAVQPTVNRSKQLRTVNSSEHFQQEQRRWGGF